MHEATDVNGQLVTLKWRKGKSKEFHKKIVWVHRTQAEMYGLWCTKSVPCTINDPYM